MDVVACKRNEVERHVPGRIHSSFSTTHSDTLPLSVAPIIFAEFWNLMVRLNSILNYDFRLTSLLSNLKLVEVSSRRIIELSRKRRR